MATNIKETVTVDALSKYGVKVGADYYNWSKQIKEADKGKVVPGGVYDMDLYIADSGKKYINSVAGPAVGAVLRSTQKPAEWKGPVKPEVVKKAPGSEVMSKAEWADKDTRISRQGAIQAAIKALAPIIVEDLFTEAAKLADQMLDYVNKK